MQYLSVLLVGASVLGRAFAIPAADATILTALTTPVELPEEIDSASANTTGKRPLLSFNSLSPSNTTKDVEKRAKCRVNAAYYGNSWTENGLTRKRLDFSSEGTPQQWFCDHWCSLWTNVQCGYDARERGGTWRLDASMAAGAYSDNFEVCMGNVLQKWIAATGCETG